jgi:hypothetical protein
LSFLEVGSASSVSITFFSQIFRILTDEISIDYWDSYWILKGLIQSQLFDAVNATLQNFMDELEKFGFIPNGGRGQRRSETWGETWRRVAFI